MVIDFHTHSYTDALAPKAQKQLEETANRQWNGTGTVASADSFRIRDGVDVFVVLNIATTPHSTRKVNEFASLVNSRDNMVGFGSVHPQSEDLQGDIDHILDLGLKGVKLHPFYQHFYADDPDVFRVYEKLEKAGLWTVFHAGYDPLDGTKDYITPVRSLAVHKAFPGLKMVLAHLGGNRCWDDVERYLVGQENIYMDTALLEGYIRENQLKRIIQNHGYEYILLGSDFPWHTTSQEIQMIKRLGLEKVQEEAILGENAKRILEL